ncbi:MAG: hypothetical protein CMC56_04035 [Flavobacteriaceae bacterium]|nr:hypothetical protein [Flavobacteriaceae bacterium]
MKKTIFLLFLTVCSVVIGQNNLTVASTASLTIADEGGVYVSGDFINSVTLGNADVTDIYMSEDSEAALHTGSGYFAGDVVVSSDARLKANIVSLGTTLARLLLIDGKSYTMKKSGEQKIGVLAQDIQKVFPELVVVDQNEILAVNYQGLVPVLINAMKEQDAKISKLEMMVEKLISDKE